MKSFATAMPAMVRHCGTWEGIYRHVALDGSLVDQHAMTTICEFPNEGPWVYVQHNHLRWPDGREERRSFGGSWDGTYLRWDTERFGGYGWETLEGIVMLKLTRRDEPGLSFIEMITLSDDGNSRARTWQWFLNGDPFRRTLCDEHRTG